MDRLRCLAFLVLAWWAGLAAGVQGPRAQPMGYEPLSYEPVGLGWTAEEVERVSLDSIHAITRRAAQQGRLGCVRHCARLDRLFKQLVAQARSQSAAASARRWSLNVVRLPDVDAMAMPGGQVIISEQFIDQRGLSDEALAFVLAHEMAHSILEHERQALTFARMLLPRHVPRSVRDIYTEMEFNIQLLKAMEPVMQQGEFEADELGLLLASRAGHSPDRQLAFIEAEARRAPANPSLVNTHPAMSQRLDRLRERLPLARRLMPPAAARACAQAAPSRGPSPGSPHACTAARRHRAAPGGAVAGAGAVAGVLVDAPVPAAAPVPVRLLLPAAKPASTPVSRPTPTPSRPGA